MDSKSEAMAMKAMSLDSNLNFKSENSALMSSQMHNALYQVGDFPNQAENYHSAFGYWRDYYYPTVIKESYPIYIQERAQDKGKQAFEIIKILQDKRLMKLEKVSDFIDAMDALIKIL